MEKAPFLIVRSPTRDELIEAFQFHTPIELTLKPYGPTEGFDIGPFTILMYVYGLREVEGEIMVEGTRATREDAMPVLARGWEIGTGFIWLETGRGLIELSALDLPRPLSGIMRNSPEMSFFIKGD